MKQVDIRNVLGKRLVKRKKILYIVSIIKMRKLLSIVLATILMLTFSVSALAQTQKTTVLMPISDELKNAAVFTLTREDGSVVETKPTLTLERVSSNSRSDIKAYKLTAEAKVNLNGTSDNSASDQGDATVAATIYYYENGLKLIADKIHVTFETGDVGTTIFNREATLRGNGVGKKYSDIPMSFTKSSINYVCDWPNRAGLIVKADVEGFGFTDSLSLDFYC